ncbi:hypothetical protein Ga0100231_018915 [Opitutaceae bacterium TAV4]|nr:hypothetical protein Ga0100231_018915 [Opitutaceae bacterium TAV4]RRK00169.1 hypothetical protein Ga0100230_019580 [Opitutaceae bacterium TAV3]
MKNLPVVFLSVLALFAAGCGPSQSERDARERARLELEEQSRRDAERANQAITEINKKMFRKLTPEEQAQREAEKQRQVQELLDAQKKADAEAAGSADKIH